MNKKMISLALNETDPFFIMEFLIIFVGFVSVETFFSPVIFYENRTGYFLESISQGIYISSLLYATVASGFFARSIERGSLGHLMTMPINRRLLIIHYILQATLMPAILFLIPICFIGYLTFSTIDISLIAFAFLIALIFLFLYNSTGFLIAAITRSSVFTAMFVFIFFFILGGYSSTIFPKNVAGQFILSGFAYFMNQQSYTWSLIVPLILVMIAGVIAMMLVYPVLRIRGLRSGR